MSGLASPSTYPFKPIHWRLLQYLLLSLSPLLVALLIFRPALGLKPDAGRFMAIDLKHFLLAYLWPLTYAIVTLTAHVILHLWLVVTKTAQHHLIQIFATAAVVIY